jgi:hypothetical protein
MLLRPYFSQAMDHTRHPVIVDQLYNLESGKEKHWGHSWRGVKRSLGRRAGQEATILSVKINCFIPSGSTRLVCNLQVTRSLFSIVRAGKVSVEIIQKVLNRWLPVCFDLFGHERSRGASKAYLWGLKGRFNEEEAGPLKDPEAVNAAARELYYREVQSLVELLNKESAEGKPRLYVPDIKFRHGIGEYKDRRFSVKGEPLDEKAS